MKRSDKLRGIMGVVAYVLIALFSLYGFFALAKDFAQQLFWLALWLYWFVMTLVTVFSLPKAWRQREQRHQRKRSYRMAQQEFISNIEQYRTYQRTMSQSNNK